MKGTQGWGRDDERDWQEALGRIVEKASMSEDRQARMLEEIHMEIQERSRKNMRRLSGKKIGMAVALIAVLAATTAIGAGKIANLQSGHNPDEIDYASAQAVMESTVLHGNVKAVEAFQDGARFESGYSMEVEGLDENGNKVGSYPEIMVMYEGGLTLGILNPPTDMAEENTYPVVCSETYTEVPVQVTKMEYLFLPPDAQPSEEDVKRNEEGKLEISYGTDKEERKVFLGAQWQEDGLRYLLFTMEDGADAEALLGKAKEIIDVER